MRKYLAFLFIILISFSFGCNSKTSDNKNQINKPNNDSVKFQTGVILPKVSCLNDPFQNYTLYLPSCYDPKKLFPVIYAFDAHARGKLPVELLKESAEKYGIILIGSNNIKNGLTTINQALQTLIDDSKTRISIDLKRIYLAGFSGGGRVASTLAISGGFAGVISCAAGIPEYKPNDNITFDYIAIVGDKDFNYLEMLDTEFKLNLTKQNHQLIIFEGKHDWPDKELMSEAVRWLQISAMKRKLIPKDDSLLKYSIAFSEKQIKTYQNENKYLEIYLTYNKLAIFLNGLTDISKYIPKLTAYNQYIKDEEQLAQQEEQKREQYVNEFLIMPVNYWFDEIEKQLNLSKNGKNIQQKNMAHRLINFLSMLSYLGLNSAFSNNDINKASKIQAIYQKADPDNPDVYYFTACLEARKGNSENAFINLEKSVNLGFYDLEKLENDRNLSSIKNDERYFKITDRLKK